MSGREWSRGRVMGPVATSAPGKVCGQALHSLVYIALASVLFVLSHVLYSVSVLIGLTCIFHFVHTMDICMVMIMSAGENLDW